MKINPQYTLKELAGEHIIVQQGTQGVDLTKIISFNTTSVFLWETFVDKTFSEEDVVQALMNQYGIERSLAVTDSHAWCQQLRELQLILE